MTAENCNSELRITFRSNALISTTLRETLHIASDIRNIGTREIEKLKTPHTKIQKTQQHNDIQKEAIGKQTRIQISNCYKKNLT